MRIERVCDDKKRYLDLLLLADPCEEMVEKYLADGEMYVLYDGDEAVCECVMYEREDGQIELKNLATSPDRQRQGHASALVREMFCTYAGRYERMYVGTCGAESFYESLGFRYSYTDPGFFTRNYPEPVIDNGVQCIDMVYLVKDLH
jgi:ribosomal protein S18 acetylase RimI-like enzyme